MIVLVIVHQFLPRHAAGSEYYTYYLAKQLQRLGHQVHLYFTEMDAERPHAELRSDEFDGLPYHEAINNHAFPSFRHHYHDEQMEANLGRVLDAVQPDIVHIQHLHLHSVGYISILKQRGLKIVYTLHEYFAMCHRNGQLLRLNMELCEGPEPSECARCAMGGLPHGESGEGLDEHQLYLQAVERRRLEVQAGLDQVDLFISPSEFLRDKFVETGLVPSERIIHSDNGLPLDSMQPLPHQASDELRFGYFGSISQWKGVHLLVEAFNGLPEQGLACKIYGDLEFVASADYVEDVRALQTNDAVRFLGRFENSLVAGILAEIDVLVVPSIWFENSPLTIHEAFYAGVPVLCSDRGGMAELVEDGVNGLHFRLGDHLDLRAKIIRFLEEPQLLSALRAGIPCVKHIRDDAKDMERRYQCLLAGESVSA